MQTGVVIIVLERMSSFFFGTRHNEKLKNCAYIEIIIYISLTFYEPLLAWISGLFITLETGLLCIRFLHSQCIIILLYRYSCCKRLKWEKSTSVVTNNSILCNAMKIVFFGNLCPRILKMHSSVVKLCTPWWHFGWNTFSSWKLIVFNK